MNEEKRKEMAREIASQTYGDINNNELALLMLEWAESKAHLDMVEDRIVGAVTAIGATVKTGDVVAKYRKPIRDFLYQDAVKAAVVSQDAIANNTTTTFDWEGICKEMEIPDDLIDRHAIHTVNWKGVCADEGIDAESVIKAPSKVTVSIAKK